MDEDSKAFPASIRVMADLMRPVLMEGMQMHLWVGVGGELSICFLPLCLPDD